MKQILVIAVVAATMASLAQEKPSPPKEQQVEGSANTAKVKEWVNAGDIEFRVLEAKRSSLVETSFGIYVGGMAQESRFCPIAAKSSRGLEPNPKVYFSGEEGISFLPFDAPLLFGERLLEIMTVILEVRSPENKVPADKARLLDEEGKQVSSADRLNSLLNNELYKWGVSELSKNQRMLLFAVSLEQRHLRFQLGESTKVAIEKLSQGYWKNHPDAWPVASLALGSNTYSKAELLTILNTAIGSGKSTDASLLLADQLITAKLNIANGLDPGPTAATIATADSLLGGCNLPCRVKFSSSISSRCQQMMNAAFSLGRSNDGANWNGAIR